MSRFRFVSDFAPDYGVKRLCRVLKVSRSGYYTWCRRPAVPHSPPRRRAGRVSSARSTGAPGGPMAPRGSTPSSVASTSAAGESGWPA